MEQMMESIFIEILNMSLTASVIVLVVFLARLLLKKAPRICSYALWGIVLFRLLCPFSFESDFSMLSVLQSKPAVEGRMEYIPQHIGYELKPQINMPIEAMDEIVNASLPAGNPAGSVNPLQIVLYISVRIWILGMLILMIRSGISLFKLRKKLRTAVLECDNIYRVSGNTSPFVYGIFKPRIYLPESLESSELEYVLLHEQIHIKRGDHIYRLLAYLAFCVHWFNPLVWAAFSFSGRDMEISCDEAVIRKMGSGVKKEYSASLLNLACGSKIVKGIPLAFGESDTGSRIKHVLKYKKPAKILAITAGVISVILALVLLANPAKKDTEYSMYGVAAYAELDGSQQLVVNLPRTGHVLIPDAEEIYPYMGTDFKEVESGDLIKITFANSEVGILESYPAEFTSEAKSIEIKGKGFAMNYERNNIFSFGLPEGVVSGAGIADTVEIYHRDPTIDGQETDLLASVEIYDTDQEADQVWIELSMEQAETFLSEYGAGVYCNLIKREDSYNDMTDIVRESSEFNPAEPKDGIYSISVRSIAQSARCIDRYVSDAVLDGQPALYFADNCDFFVNWQWTSVRYEEVSFQEFANLVNDKNSDNQSVSCNLTFKDGLITKAELHDGYYKYGISYQPGNVYDYWYEHITTTISEEEGIDALDTYYTLVDTITMELSDFEEGEEVIEIYTGNIGDGDSGIILFKNMQGEVIHSESAHHARAGWNNVYLVEDSGKSYILTVRIEDRDTYGGYGYQVYEIGPMGMILQRAGTGFEFGDPYSYDDDLFREWVSGLEYYLERSYLLLSSQEGEIRTEHICELDKYNYETLKRE